ncbi:hypothetical protein LJC56_10915, partial [Christensenellaceae bacterium OttesenSCG-928-K19]|nr:hypothetical protein [Christensenellaceae bacterium OttesenSCG-928-K19]
MHASLMIRDRLKARRFKDNVIVILLFFIIPWLVYALGVDVTTQSLAAGDGVIYGYPTKAYSAGGSLWNPYVTGGTYTVKDVGAQTVYPLNVVMMLFPNMFGFNVFLMLHYSLGGIFTFLYLRSIELEMRAAFLGGIVFMFSGFMAAHLGHHSMVSAAVYALLILYAVEKYLKKNHFGFLLLGAGALALSILADYLAVTFYTGMIVLPYIIYRSIAAGKTARKGARKVILDVVKLILAIFLGGVLLAMVYVLPVIESLPYATRESVSYEFFSSYNFPAFMLPMLLFPFLYGGTNVFYFMGPWNFSELSGYMAILVVIVAGGAFLALRKKNSLVWFWAIVAVAGFVLTLGADTPVYNLMYQMPGYNMFRAPARNWYEVNFAFTILFAIGLDYLLKVSENRRARKLYTNKLIKISVLVGAVAV